MGRGQLDAISDMFPIYETATSNPKTSKFSVEFQTKTKKKLKMEFKMFGLFFSNSIVDLQANFST